MKKVKIELSKKQSSSYFWNVTITLPHNDYKIKRISGHRFVSLLGKAFENDLDLILDFLGLKPFVDNIYTQMGNYLEPFIRDWYNKDAIDFTFEEYKGDSLGGDSEFSGLMDGYIKDNNEAIEIKTYMNPEKMTAFKYDYSTGKSKRINVVPEEYLQQIQLYWEINNKNQYDKFPIDKFTLITCFVEDPENPKLKEENITVFPLERNEELSKELLERALERKAVLMTVDKDNKLYCKIPIKRPYRGRMCKANYITKYIDELKENKEFEVIVNE